MDLYLHLGYMKKVTEPDDRIAHCYIPHHVVFKESNRTTKVRIDFDASCNFLNGKLLVGPTGCPAGPLHLLEFPGVIHRCHAVADVEMM